MLWLLTIRPTETWTPLTVALSLALLVLVLVAIGWAIATVSSRGEAADPERSHRWRRPPR